MEENIEILIEKMNKELDFLIENANKTEQLTATSIMTMKQPIILLFLSVLSNYQKVLKENETLKCSIAVANKLEELIKEDFIPKGKIVDIIEKEEYIKVSIKDIFDVKIHNFNYLSETDWSEAQRIIDKEVANILQQILQELLESEETNDKNNKKG
nr:MAG TPA: hypothetical protein [Caudoviricetes sp.]